MASKLKTQKSMLLFKEDTYMYKQKLKSNLFMGGQALCWDTLTTGNVY